MSPLDAPQNRSKDYVSLSGVDIGRSLESLGFIMSGPVSPNVAPVSIHPEAEGTREELCFTRAAGTNDPRLHVRVGRWAGTPEGDAYVVVHAYDTYDDGTSFVSLVCQETVPAAEVAGYLAGLLEQKVPASHIFRMKMPALPEFAITPAWLEALLEEHS